MYKRVIGILFFNCDTVIVILFIGHLLFRGFLFYAASDHFVHLLSDGKGFRYFQRFGGKGGCGRPVLRRGAVEVRGER